MTNGSSAQPTADQMPWPALLTLSAAAFVTVTAELLPASVLLPMSDGLGVTRATAGTLVSAWAVTVALLSLPLVTLTRRLPRKQVLVGALAVFSTATVVTASAPTFELALVSRVVAAAAHGLFWSLLVVTAAGLVPPERLGRAVSVVLAGPAVAGVVGVPGGGAVGAAMGWRASFAGLAVLMVAAAVAIAVLEIHDAPQAPPGAGSRDAGLASVLAVAVAGALVLTGHFLAYTYIAPLMQDVGQYDAAARNLLLVLFGAAGVAGIAGSGWLSDRWPRHALTGVAIAFTISVASLSQLDRGPLVAGAAVVAWGVLIGLLPPVFQTRIVRLAPPDAQAAAGAVAVTVLNLGIASGAAVGGLVLSARGAAALPSAAALVIGVAAAGLLTADVRLRGGGEQRDGTADRP